MTVLITGAPGWIGTSLVNCLAKNGEQFRCFVLEGIDNSPLTRFTNDIVTGDVRRPATLKSALANVDTVFHLAAVLHSTRVRDFYDVNVQGTENLLDACLKQGVKRFIHVSSDAVCGYDAGRNMPKTEKYVGQPLGPYQTSKFLAEQIVNKAYEEHGLKTTIIRPCGLYGPGQPARIVTFMKKIGDRKAPLFGDGQNRNSMTYVEDAVTGLLLARRSRKAIGETYFIADEQPYSMVKYYQTIAKALGVPFRPWRVPVAVSAMSESMERMLLRMGIHMSLLHALGYLRHDLTCSIEKAKKELGYKPSVGLEQGIANAVAWCRERGML